MTEKPLGKICSAEFGAIDDYPADVCAQVFHFCPHCGAKMDGGEHNDQP